MFRKTENPDPPDGATGVTAPILQWDSGTTAAWHDVYLGTNPTPGAAEYKGRQPLAWSMWFEMAGGVPGTTYYWRIDEVEQDNTTKHTGDVWTFRTIPDIPITDPDLVGWWKLDEATGRTAIDWSGHDNHGTLQGDPQWVAQVYDGGALDFDGSDDWVTTGIMPVDYGLDGGSPKTVTSWVYTRGFNDGGIYDMGSQSDGREFCLRTLGTVNNWRVQGWGYPTHDFDVVYPTQNQWGHFAQVYAAGLTTLYANGVSIVDCGFAGSGRVPTISSPVM